MKIAQFIASTGWGGAEKQFVELVNAQAKTDLVTAILLQGSRIVDEINKINNNVHIVLLPDLSRRNPLLYGYLYKLLRQYRFDIIHSHQAKASSITYRISGFIQAAHIATKHNSRPNNIYEKIRFVTAVSKQAARSVKKGAIIIPDAITPVQIPESAKSKPADTFTIVAAGRLDPIKGFAELISAVAGTEQAIQLLIAGDGPQLQSLQQLCTAPGAGKRITLLGYRNDIPELMASAQIVVINSATEGFSLVLLESLYYANLVISTRVGIAEEILPDALLFEHGQVMDKITEVMLNYEKYKQAFIRIKDKKENYLLDNVVHEYRNYYEHVLRKSNLSNGK